ncbi:HNH endonuclease signature motif containing protein [Leucobacter celer]|uniref:HNH endonuclease signature motif containing protein n=1 Tax=Leucobacter celer TaxID=668625 RepID=UPI001F4D211A|nr:HNH endonuclease signature motif containing protein [Leucobacter celer]
MELLQLASTVGQMAERLRVVAAGVVAQRSTREAGHAGLAQSQGHRNAVALVQQVTGMSRSEAARQVRVGTTLYDSAGAGAACAGAAGADAGAGELEASVTSAGRTDTANAEQCTGAAPGTVAPWHACLGRALLNGAISAAQHDAILRGLGRPPEHRCGPQAAAQSAQSAQSVQSVQPVEHDCVREALEDAARWSAAADRLVSEASHRTVEDLAQASRFVRDQLDPEGAEARYLARYEQRSFRIWIDRDGLHRGSLVCDDLSAARLRAIFDSALRPRRGGPSFVTAEEQTRAKALIEDPRSNEQLAHDLILDLIEAGSLATPETVYGTRQAGVRLVRLGESDGTPAAGRFEDTPATVPSGVVDQQVCASGIVPVTIDRAGRPLDVGREQRLYTSRQRIALAVRDGGCRWPGCDRPPAYCEAHHIDEWQKDQGRTDLDRGVLLCRFHHMQLHANSWRITRTGDGTSARDGTGVGFGDGDAGSGLGPDSGCFMLHDPDGRAIPMRPRLELRYAWGDLGPPRQRFRLVA